MKQRSATFCLSFCLSMAISVNAVHAQSSGLYYPELVDKFYTLNENENRWMTSSVFLRQELVHSIDSFFYLGMIDKKYHINELKLSLEGGALDSILLRKQDRYYTDAAIALCKDIYQGFKLKPWVGYDQLSSEYAEKDNYHIIEEMAKVRTTEQLKLFIASLEPEHGDYVLLREELIKQRRKGSADTARLLQIAMNYYRWMHHFKFEKMIVVNIPSTRLRYYENDSVVLDMKVVLGQTSTPTPRFATVCDQAILYPYWYVPPSIIFNEYLPKIKKNPSWLDSHNMQVIDSRGRVMDHERLNWSSFGKGNFPYSIRQSTGCDNALGVIKFNINTPYGVYLHDTNNKTAFLLGLRYLSHGCIRIEEPLELGNQILDNQLDTAFLQSCFKEQKPVSKKLGDPVPVFVVYMPVVIEMDGSMRYYKDIYNLLK